MESIWNPETFPKYDSPLEIVKAKTIEKILSAVALDAALIQMSTHCEEDPMNRYAVISLPDAVETGLAASLLFFDKVFIPDQKYVADALHEIEHPEVFSSKWDLDRPSTISEVQLGLGYYLWNGQVPYNWLHRPKALLRDIEYLEQRGLATTITERKSELQFRRKGSFQSFLEILDEQRIHTALQIATGDFVDVCTVRHQLDKTSLTSVPTTLNKEYVVRFFLSQIPTPVRDVPIDEILDFRNDSKVQADLSRLRSWMTKAGKELESPVHLEDEYRVLYEDYKQAVSRLSRRYQTSTIGIITTVAAEFADNLAQLKLGSAVKSLLDWQSTIIEKEDKLQEAPGREFAYLKRIEEAFSN